VISFIQRIRRNVEGSPDKIILSDGRGEYTNRQLWELSSRVYAHLCGGGIGREDVVMLRLPRGAEAVMVAVGVWRAGAAVIVMDEGLPEELFDSTCREVSPACTIDSAVMGSIALEEPLDGFVLPDLHDLAYIAYTSGTSAQRKGVLQEYGTIERYWQMDEDGESYSTALTASLHSNLVPVLYALACNSMVDIVPAELFGDWGAFVRRLEEKRVETTYMSPVYYHRFGIPYTPFLKYVSTSFEPVCGLFSERFPLVNEYGATELGTTAAEFVIDRKYDITPIGKPLKGFTFYILDENDRPVPDGEIGEICVDCEYCRGYLNRPEETLAQFRNGLYHTRDLGKRLPDGNYIMYGRTTDALKCSEGLIVALEIEVEARKLLHDQEVYAKVFERPEGRPVVCLYSTKEVDFGALVAELAKILSSYKLPTHFVRVNHFEINNGKVIRCNLENPLCRLPE